MGKGDSPKKNRKLSMIIEAAQELFLNHGVKRVTVEEICRKAKVSKMTFYKHFKNKEELFFHIWEGWVDEGFQLMDEIDALDISLPEKIQMMFEWKTRFLSKTSSALIEDIIKFDLKYDKPIARFMEFIVNAQKRGEIRPDIKPVFLMTVLDWLYGLVNDENLISSYPSVIEFNREIKDFFWYGVMAR